MTKEELDQLLERARDKLDDDDHSKLEALVQSFVYLTGRIKSGQLQEIRELLLRNKTEKTADVLERAGVDSGAEGDAEGASGQDGSAPASSSDETSDDDDGEPALAGGPATSHDSTSQDKSKPKPKPKRKGHGRIPASAYTGAEQTCVNHDELKPGDTCPRCGEGKVYEQQRPSVLVNVVGQAPLAAKVCESQRLRCNLCGEVFASPAAEGFSQSKYDPSCAAMIGVLKYGTGLPFHRLEKLQDNLGVPLPAGTQSELVKAAAEQLKPAYEELIYVAAQGEVLHNDDTSATVRELAKEIEAEAKELAAGKKPGSNKQRTGIFTTGIVAQVQEQRVALFFTGRRHAGENLADVLSRRAPELDAPIQMCDALDRNLPKELEVILSNCVAHGRRKFVKLIEHFPQECKHVLEALGEVYAVDAQARSKRLSPDERLALHQERSAPVMAELEAWMRSQLAEKQVEENSGLGTAMNYMLKRWDKLTLFLREPGAPIDNNVCERALKKSVLHRKNALFFKTKNGAQVSDIFMSLIHTCELSKVNPFDYVVALLRNADAVAASPRDWLPWTYRATGTGERAA